MEEKFQNQINQEINEIKAQTDFQRKIMIQ